MTLTSPAMTDHVPDIHPTAAPLAPSAPAAGTAAPVATTVAAPAVVAAATAATAPAEPAAGEAGNSAAASSSSSGEAGAAPAGVDSGSDATATADATRPAGSGNRRGGRNRRKSGSPDAAQAQQPSPKAEGAKPPRGPRPIPPALEKLAALYPQLFGAVFRPLKRGIFQDLMAAHPEDFEREALKVALGIHTRSTRYLQSVAAGQQRHDLQGQAVEAMAPEHVHQALLEVHRRRSGRNNNSNNNSNNSNNEDLLLKLRARIVANIESSGLSREAYAERVRTRDEAANALLDEALAEMAAKTAREEALVRAFEASGKTVEAFADMYGMDPRNVVRSLHSARARDAAAATAAAQQEQEQKQSSSDSDSDTSGAVPADTAPSSAPAPALEATPAAVQSPAAAAPSPHPTAEQAAAADTAEAVDAADAAAQDERKLWCLRSPMTMTPPAPRRGRWS